MCQPAYSVGEKMAPRKDLRYLPERENRIFAALYEDYLDEIAQDRKYEAAMAAEAAKAAAPARHGC